MISIVWQTNNGLTGISTMVYLNSIISLFLVQLLLKQQKLHTFDYTNLVVEHFMFQYFYTRLSIFFSFKVYLQLIQYVRKWVPFRNGRKAALARMQYAYIHIFQETAYLHIYFEERKNRQLFVDHYPPTPTIWCMNLTCVVPYHARKYFTYVRYLHSGGFIKLWRNVGYSQCVLAFVRIVRV